MSCKCGLKVEVLRSAAGWYIGTRTEEGFPNCRMTDYFATKELAEKVLNEAGYNCAIC